MSPAPQRARGSHLAAVAALLGLSLIAPLGAADTRVEGDEATSLRGRVTDAAGAPVAGATVRVLRQGLSWQRRETFPETWSDPVVVETDEQGAFVADALDGAEFAVRVEAAGRAPTTVEEIPLGAWLSLHVAPGHEVRGRVLEGATDEGLAGATVIACDAAAFAFGRDACRRAPTDEGGAFLVTGAPDGALQLRAQAPGHAFSELRSIVLPRTDDSPLTLRLEPGARVRGRVLDERDRPVPGARVDARPIAGRIGQPAAPAGWPTHADDNGTFDLEGLPAERRLGLLAYRSDRGVGEGRAVRLDAGVDVEGLEIRLPTTATVTLRLVDVEGHAVEGFEIFFRETGPSPGEFIGPLEPWRIERGPGERITARIPREGLFDLRFAAAGASEIDLREVGLVSGRTTDLGTLVASSGARVSGRVTDTSGLAIPDATVEASWEEGGFRRSKRTLADQEGRYTLGGLSRSAVRIEASAKGYVTGGVGDVRPEADAVDVALEPTGGLAGRVRLEEGGIPEAFLIVVHAEAGAPDGSAAADTTPPRPESFASEDGSYRVEELPPGSYTVEARADGRAPGRRTGIRVATGEIADVAPIELSRGLTLRGRVLVAEDDSPLAGALLTAAREGGGLAGRSAARRATATSDQEGRFTLDGLEPGAHLVVAAHPAFAPVEERVDLSDDGDADDLVLRLSRGGTLAGTVRDASGSPAAGRRLVLSRDLTRVDDLPVAHTDADGEYELQQLAPGSYVVSLVPQAGATLRLQIKNAGIREGEVTRLDFDESSPITLEGTVLRDGKPLPDAQIFFSRTFDLTDFKFTNTDGDGRYEVGLEEAGRYRVMVEPGAGGASTEIEVPDLPRVRQDIRLDGDGIGGSVSDGAGQPLAGAVVSASPVGHVDGAPPLLVAETAADGRYTIAGLRPGQYRLSAAASGFRVAVVPAVELIEGAAALVIDFTLERGSSLAGRLLDGSGRGIAGAAVLAVPAGSVDAWGTGAATAVTDVNGAFRLTSPGDGPLDLAALPSSWAPARLYGVAADGEEILLHATRGGSLRVQVVDGQGAPLPGVSVAARPVPPYLGSELVRLLTPPTATDGAGVVRIPNLAPGSYEIGLVGAPQAAPAVATVEEGAETLVRIEPGG